jgi:hypothetical protein
MAISERKVKNDLYWLYSFGHTVAECSAQLKISRIWAAHTLATMCRGDKYIEGAHLRGKKSPYRKAKFIYINPQDRYFDHGV